MKNHIASIKLDGNNVTIERAHQENGIRTYDNVTHFSISRLHQAVSNVVNQRYSPRITLFNGEYEVEW